MRKFLSQLKQRNPILFWYGWMSLACAIICAVLIQVDTKNMVLNINAWIKPTKFFLSVWIFCWTIAWYLYYLKMPKRVLYYSWMTVIVMTFELSVITWQAANGRLSHFNVSTPLYAALFNAMGIAITVLTIWTAYMDYLFFKKKDIDIKLPYLWAIRIGILFFIIFSLEGGVMAAMMHHAIDDLDNSPGIPFFNWNKLHGDLRVAHFFGIHSLQVIPLVGYYLANNKKQILLFASLYFIWVVVLLVQALLGIPIF